MGSMASAATTSARPYGGVDAADRLATRRAKLLAAGLDLLGADRDDAAELTVRGICRQAGVAARYFYESFADKDEFVGAVFDWVIADLAATTQAAVAAAPPEEQTRAGMANIVRTIGSDARWTPARCLRCFPVAMTKTRCRYRQTTGSRPPRISWSVGLGRRSAPGWPVRCGSIPIS
jgi:AcrR family transcriptional regulator